MHPSSSLSEGEQAALIADHNDLQRDNSSARMQGSMGPSPGRKVHDAYSSQSQRSLLTMVAMMLALSFSCGMIFVVPSVDWAHPMALFGFNTTK